jgi:hypothetical protein
MKTSKMIKKQFQLFMYYGVLTCTTLMLPHGAQAATWGAQAGIGVSTCGGEVAKSHSLGFLGDSGVDVELTASQFSCGGLYGYAGDLPYAYAHARASLSDGTLGIYAQADGLGTQLTTAYGVVTAPVANVSNVSAILTDVLSFSVPAHTPGTITFTSAVTGASTTGAAAVHFGMGGSVNCTSDSCWGMLSGNWNGIDWGIDDGGIVSTSIFTRIITIEDSSLPLTFDYLFVASLSGSAHPVAGWVYGGSDISSANIDYLHTAELGYTLPTGVSFTSASGLFLTSTVPIPAAIWLFGSGMLGLIGVARRKKA